MTGLQKPAPIVIEPSQAWDGNDGLWSSFTLGIGTPPQFIRVLVSTVTVQPWVVLPAGCTSQDPVDCATTRGGLIYTNESTTWHDAGYYALYFEQNLGLEGNGDFGFDALSLGLLGTGAPTVPNQVVAGMATKDFYLGYFGLGPDPTNFTTLNTPQQSLLSYLKEQNMLPSTSWAYTAGANYRLKGALGSLTLGGYDDGLYTPNNLTFNFAHDSTRNLVVGIQTITAGGVNGSRSNLLPTPILSFIDSTVSHIWLPLESCQYFEEAFGLVLDPATDLYLINDTQHHALLAMNANITFTFGNDLSSIYTIDITLPYASFDLELTNDYPGIGNMTRYFPLRRAANETQYTLGRTFLQEAYLIADYERSTFSVNQCLFSEDYKSNIQAIYPPSNTTSLPSSSHSPSSNPQPSPNHPTLSTGAITAIAIAAMILFLFVLSSILLYIRSRRRRLKAATGSADNADMCNKPELHSSDVDLTRPRAGELHDNSPKPELAAPYVTQNELDDNARAQAELQGSVNVHELENPPGLRHELP